MNAPAKVREIVSAAPVFHPPHERQQDAATWPAPLDLRTLAQRDPVPPEFIINDWLPAGYATLLAGHGGLGKSGIALYLATCIASGLPFFGLQVAQRRVIYLSCEDRESVLHWRLARICAHLNVQLDGLHESLDVVDLVGHDAVLWERDPSTRSALTAPYGQLDCLIKSHHSEVLFVDGISDTYAGAGGSKTDVKRYVNALVALIPPERGAVVLVGHIDKKSAKEGAGSEGYDGTTGWHNSVRARWYLYPETESSDEGDRQRTGDLLLELQKSNLGRIDQSMRFAWSDEAHIFVGREVASASAFDRAHRERVEERDLLRAFSECAAKEIPVPAATSGQRTAYHVLSATKAFPDTLKRGGKPSRARFWRLIEKLRQSGALVPTFYKDGQRHQRAALSISTEGARQCVE